MKVVVVNAESHVVDKFAKRSALFRKSAAVRRQVAGNDVRWNGGGRNRTDLTEIAATA
jgi:hypothetical protein